MPIAKEQGDTASVFRVEVDVCCFLAIVRFIHDHGRRFHIADADPQLIVGAKARFFPTGPAIRQIQPLVDLVRSKRPSWGIPGVNSTATRWESRCIATSIGFAAVSGTVGSLPCLIVSTSTFYRVRHERSHAAPPRS